MIKIQNEKFNSGKLIDNFLERNLYSGGFASFIGKARNSTYNNGQKFTINRIERQNHEIRTTNIEMRDKIII